MKTVGTLAEDLAEKIRVHQARIGVIGLGYVGLPLAVEFWRAGFSVIGLDVDSSRVTSVNLGESYISDVGGPDLRIAVSSGKLRATDDYDAVRDVDVVVICVQTPFTETKEPDLRFVTKALWEVRTRLHTGQLIILQSTTYPGTTEEVALPILSAAGLRVGEDFFLAFSPERVDPGNAYYATPDIPKVVGGVTPACTQLGCLLFEQIVDRIHPVSSARVAEMTKLLENIFRSVNVALVNELTMLCERMGIDVWEVITAAATKPFGFMAFYPGPGVGGHCIPVDPYYLSWKAKAFDFNTKFVALAAEINENMPYYVVDRLTEAVNIHSRKSIAEASIFALGVAYKPGVADVRESPAIKVLERLRRRGAAVTYHDPFVDRIRLNGREYASVDLTEEEIHRADCVVILTDHEGIDYGWVVEHSRLTFDTRNATKLVVDPTGKIIRL